MKTSALKADPKNPRKISAEQKKMLKNSIEKFGDLSGIVFNRRTQQVISGHQRLTILPKNSEIEIHTNYDQPTKTGTVAEGSVSVGSERFVYREVDVDETMQSAMNVAANKHGGAWEDDKLREILADLVSAGIDMDLVGFTSEELEKLMGSSEVYDAQCDEDEVSEPPKEPRSRIGDLYELGNHRLLCGDSTSIDAIEVLLSGQRIDMVFTSPPYNAGKKGFEKKGKYENSVDSDDSLWMDLVSGFMSAWINYSEYLFVNLQILSGNKIKIHEWLYTYRLNFVDQMSLVKSTLPAMEPNILNAEMECMYIFRNIEKPTKHIKLGKDFRGTLSNVYQMKRSGGEFSKDHRAGFHVSFPENFINMFLGDDKIAADPFGGTGTTLIACEKAGRKCFMMELDPKYVDVIVSRYVKFSGNANIKRNGEDLNWTESETKETNG